MHVLATPALSAAAEETKSEGSGRIGGTHLVISCIAIMIECTRGENNGKLKLI
jgi:hypothetical protein